MTFVLGFLCGLVAAPAGLAVLVAMAEPYQFPTPDPNTQDLEI